MARNGTKYNQIADYYMRQIESKELKDGDKFPSEAEMSQLFMASRITVRRAMDEIFQAGFVERVQGKGSFVRTIKRDMQLNHLRGFTEEMKAKGLTPTSQIISAVTQPCSQHIADHLSLNVGTQITAIERLRLADGEPVAFERVFVPFYLCPDLVHEDLSGSLYSLMSDKGLKVSKASQSISAGFAPHAVCSLLKISQNAPTLNIERITYTEDDTPLEYVLSIYRSDRYTFHVDMSR